MTGEKSSENESSSMFPLTGGIVGALATYGAEAFVIYKVGHTGLVLLKELMTNSGEIGFVAGIGVIAISFMTLARQGPEFLQWIVESGFKVGVAAYDHLENSLDKTNKQA